MGFKSPLTAGGETPKRSYKAVRSEGSAIPLVIPRLGKSIKPKHQSLRQHLSPAVGLVSPALQPCSRWTRLTCAQNVVASCLFGWKENGISHAHGLTMQRHISARQERDPARGLLPLCAGTSRKVGGTNLAETVEYVRPETFRFACLDCRIPESPSNPFLWPLQTALIYFFLMFWFFFFLHTEWGWGTEKLHM